MSSNLKTQIYSVTCLPWNVWMWSKMWLVALTQDDHQRMKLVLFSKPAEETFHMVQNYSPSPCCQPAGYTVDCVWLMFLNMRHGAFSFLFIFFLFISLRSTFVCIATCKIEDVICVRVQTANLCQCTIILRSVCTSWTADTFVQFFKSYKLSLYLCVYCD